MIRETILSPKCFVSTSSFGIGAAEVEASGDKKDTLSKTCP
jgi:hypothetical protein